MPTAMAAVREQHRARVTAPVVSGQGGFLHPQLRSEDCGRASLIERMRYIDRKR